MAKIKITQTKSRIGATERQGKNLDALGLHRINQTVEHEDSPVVLGMVEKVRHLVKIETLK
jgi:large subunit ribosomal protein L30